ncbi:branched-chain amino acid ABC transporter permease [Seohaeicola saemankumensis]|jgi:branched-chain amino acid transport system permease protein|uniref:branched-chain amino acid ABC transporter permease n=1 Tax=Seohaeicola TaxID=481178 RepID=UPI0007F4F964|nr:branched-chain amino acid ABC transporter permease [Paracoccaceae bacterium]OAN69423.1 ABC transporter permease [Rhodobacteraceae bacterium EhC02]
MRFHFKTDYDQDIRLFEDGWTFSLYAALLVLALALPLMIDPFFLGEATNVLIWAIAGLGLMLLTGQTGQVSLGHSAFMALGCYSCVLMMEANVPFVLAFLLAGVITGVVGALIAIPALKLHGVYLAIATLALAILADDIIVLLKEWTDGVNGKMSPPIDLFGYEISRWNNPIEWYYLTLAVVLMVTLFYRNLLRAPLGRAFAAVRDSEISAQAMGVNVAQTKTIAFGISCAITGLGGALMGLFAGAFNNETFNFLLSIQLLMMIVVGGLGFIHGAFLGAVVIAFLPQVLSMTTDLFGRGVAIPGLESGVFGVILILFILFEPMGLYGRWLKIRVFLELFPFARKDMFKRQKSYLKTERLR